MKIIGHYINGEDRAEKERTQDVYNPSTGEVQ